MMSQHARSTNDLGDALEESTQRVGRRQQITSESLSKAATELGDHSPT
jgi:hypothetical protein